MISNQQATPSYLIQETSPAVPKKKKKTLVKIWKFCCKEAHASLIFSYNVKIPKYLRSYVTYEFVCNGCNASYVGKTSTPYQTVTSFLALSRK